MGNFGLCLGCAGSSGAPCLAAGCPFASFLASVRMEVLWSARLVPGERPLWRPAFRVRNAGLFSSVAGDRGSAGRRGGGVHHGNVPKWLRGPLSFTTELLAA